MTKVNPVEGGGVCALGRWRRVVSLVAAACLLLSLAPRDALARAAAAEAAAKKEAAKRAELEKKRKTAAAEATARKKAEEAAGLSWKRTTALASWGVGAAGLGVGTWLALSAASERQDVEDAIATYPSHSDYVSAVDDSRRRAVIGYATLGVGAAIAGVGTWLWLDGAPEATTEWLCDGEIDCEDGSDEGYCGLTCG